MTQNMVHVDFASSRLHESTSNHSGLEVMRLIARRWNGANSYCAKFGKKNFIHSRGLASSHARCFSISAWDMERSTGVAHAMFCLNFSQLSSATLSFCFIFMYL